MQAEHHDAVADACAIGVDRGVALLQALRQLAGGEAERVLVERELHRGRALVLSAVTVVPLRAARRA